ncbi:hypothetical protein NC653_041008 [Populus alba x Populus x berolinensis]|uniref:Uncharacterized protein n=1 Tax=Populus alba x Populus x berolinensis TaxID=444605 RepID=A0AAD6L7G9_9ROSI|nr:hypothetical protein NC653_041008 [Populus alba x Populus x berolinensis]
MAATTTTPAFLTLQDRVAIVTGSSCGIGKAIAINLASLGAKLVHVFVNSASIADSKYHTIANTSVEDFDLSIAEEHSHVAKRPQTRASKAAIETKTKIFAKELKGTGITANCVAPGPTATDMFLTGTSEELIKRVIEECPWEACEDVAPLVGFLASDASEWINGRLVINAENFKKNSPPPPPPPPLVQINMVHEEQ